MERVLIAGGAGFIGSHLGDELLRSGYRVRSLDGLVDEAEVALEDGMAELARWLQGQVVTDRFDEAAAALTERGLTT